MRPVEAWWTGVPDARLLTKLNCAIGGITKYNRLMLAPDLAPRVDSVDGPYICSDGNEMTLHDCLQGSAGADERRHCPSNPNLPSAALVNSLTMDGTLSMDIFRFLSPEEREGGTHGILLGCAKEGVQSGLLYDEHEGIVAVLLKPDVVPVELGCSGQGGDSRFYVCWPRSRLPCLPGQVTLTHAQHSSASQVVGPPTMVLRPPSRLQRSLTVALRPPSHMMRPLVVTNGFSIY